MTPQLLTAGHSHFEVHVHNFGDSDQWTTATCNFNDAELSLRCEGPPQAVVEALQYILALVAFARGEEAKAAQTETPAKPSTT